MRVPFQVCSGTNLSSVAEKKYRRLTQGWALHWSRVEPSNARTWTKRVRTQEGDVLCSSFVLFSSTALAFRSLFPFRDHREVGDLK